MTLDVCSLFSGVAGMELGLGSTNFRTVLFCESDPGAQAVLKARFPAVPLVPDIRKLRSLPKCDVLTAGWPCQDLSQAGSVSGMDGPRSGLIGEVFRLIASSRHKPEFVLLENVAFALHLHGGAAISRVVAKLEDLGYNWAYRILDTQNFGLPQRRRRIFILASRNFDAASMLLPSSRVLVPQSPAEAERIGFYWTEGNRGTGWTPEATPPLKGGSALSIPSPPAIWERATGKFITPGLIDAERLQGFPAGRTRAAEEAGPQRTRWRLIGNAVSVPVARWIGGRISRGVSREDRTPEFEVVQSARRHNAAYGRRKVQATYVTAVPEGPPRPSRSPISEFRFSDAAPLSYRAAHGFLNRLLESPLKKDREFIGDLKAFCAA